jgi:multiple sugar transport system permease protein
VWARMSLLPWLLLLAALAWAFFPILYIAISSFKLPSRIWNYPPDLRGPYSLENYRDLFENWPGFLDSLVNSALITVGASTLTLLCAFPAAYVFSRFREAWLRAPAFFLIAVRLLPPIAITIPMFPILNSVGLIDNHLTLILLYAAFEVSLSTWLMKTFIDEVPIELEEAAMVDGCSRRQVLWYVVIPLSSPGLVAVIVLTSVFAWNEYLFAFVFTSSAARTAPISLAEFLGAFMGVAWGSLLAAATIHLLPMLVLVWTVQRFLVRGMQVGAIK